MPRGTSFKDMRQAVEFAVDRLIDAVNADTEEPDDDDDDAVVLEAIVKIARVGVLSLVQCAQELNEIKHILAEHTAEQE